MIPVHKYSGKIVRGEKVCLLMEYTVGSLTSCIWCYHMCLKKFAFSGGRPYVNAFYCLLSLPDYHLFTFIDPFFCLQCTAICLQC